jgi:hypothetical protein
MLIVHFHAALDRRPRGIKCDYILCGTLQFDTWNSRFFTSYDWRGGAKRTGFPSRTYATTLDKLIEKGKSRKRKVGSLTVIINHGQSLLFLLKLNTWYSAGMVYRVSSSAGSTWLSCITVSLSMI